MKWFSRTAKSVSQSGAVIAPESSDGPRVPSSQEGDGRRIGQPERGGGVLGWLKGRRGATSSKPYAAPEIEVKTSRGTRRPKPRASAHAAGSEKAFVREVLGKRAKLAAITAPQPDSSGATVQHGVAHDGAAVRVQMGAHEVSAIPSQEPVYVPPQRKMPKGLRKIMAPLHDLLPAKTSRLNTTPAGMEGGLAGVPSHFVTGVVTAASGTVFGVGPEGTLHRFDLANNLWRPIGDNDASHVYGHLGPQPDGGTYALRKSGGASEVVRVDTEGGGEPTVVHRGAGSIVSYAVSGNGTVLALDDEGKLTRSRGNESSTSHVSMYAGGIELADVSASSLGMTAEGHCFFAGDDGHLYRLVDEESRGVQRGFSAHREETPFSNPSDPIRFSTLIDLGHTVDHHSGTSTLHALYRKPTGEVFSAYHHGGDFKPGWRFDNAFIVRNMRGMEPIRIRPRDAIQINRDGVQLATKRGVLHTGREGGAWCPCSANGIVALKSNPVGLEKSYGLQVLRPAGGLERKRVVRIDILELHPTLPAGSKARLGAPATALDVKLTELASGNIRDFAVLESLGATAGDGTRVLYHVDDENRLFVHELGDEGASGGGTLVSPATDIGQVRRLSLDNAGTLFALAEREGEEPRLYQLDTGKGAADWKPQDVPLMAGHRLNDISSSWTGRLRLHVEQPADPELESEESTAHQAVYQYSPKTGITPLDRNSAIEAMKSAGGREFHLPGLPAVHVNNEWLGFKSTSRPFLSNCVNWVQSSWAHARALGSAPKVAVNWVKHKRKGREGLQHVYSAVADANRFFVDQFAGVRATTPTGQLPSYGPAAQDMQAFRDELLRSVRQILEHIGHSTGFLDANLSPSAEFRSKRPKGLTPDKDLLDTVMKWFLTYATHHGIENSDCRRALGMLRAMRESPHRVYLAFPPVEPGAVRSEGDKQGLLNARLVRDIQALHQLHDLQSPGERRGTQSTDAPVTRADLKSRLDALKSEYHSDPVVQYSNLSFQNIEQLEDTYDIVRSLSRALNAWHHPLNKTMAGSMDVKGPRDRKAALIKAANKALKRNEQLDGALLAKYGATDAASLKKVLTDKSHPEYSRVSSQLKTESREEFKRRFVDTILGLKTKESYVNDRNYAGGIDPLSWIRNAPVNGYIFAGGLLGRDYNLSVEVLGNDQKGGDLGFVLEKARDLTGEVAGGAGYSWGKEHSHGHMHHFMRAAFIAELGGRLSRSGGMLFMVPRDKLQTFADKLFDFGVKKGGAEIKDLRELLASSYERETHTRSDVAWEAKLQAFVRAGPTGTTNHAGGHFWGARASLFQAGIGFGHEKSAYKMHGRTLEGELQHGAERHDYWSQEAKIAVPGLRFRSWFNFPSNDEAKDQFAIGMGNTDNEFSLGVHNKDGKKCEYRTSLLPPIKEAQWAQLLMDAREAYPERVSRLNELGSWAADTSTFGSKLAAFRGEVESWAEKGFNKRDLLGNIDLMRWQHGLAMAGKPMYFGIVHEVRAANPSRLTKPASWTRLKEKIRPNPEAATDPLRVMNARLGEDPTLKQIIHDLQHTHPTRVKIKYEIRPDAMERLVQKQLDNPSLPEHEIKSFIGDSSNFRIKSIAALKGADASNGASVWPVIGVTSGTSTGVEELKGSVNFEYDVSGGYAGYTLEGDFASKRRSHRKIDEKFAKQGGALATMPYKYGAGLKLPKILEGSEHSEHALGATSFGKSREVPDRILEWVGPSSSRDENPDVRVGASNRVESKARLSGESYGSTAVLKRDPSENFSASLRPGESMPSSSQRAELQDLHAQPVRSEEASIKWDNEPTQLTPEEQLEVKMLDSLFSGRELASFSERNSEARKPVTLADLLAKETPSTHRSIRDKGKASMRPLEPGQSSSESAVSSAGAGGGGSSAEKNRHARFSLPGFGLRKRKNTDKTKIA